MKDEEISLKEVVFVAKEWCFYLLSKWVMILVGCLVGGLIGILYASSASPVYTAKLTFVLEGEKSGLGGYSSLAGQFGLDLGGGGGGVFEGQNLLSLMSSRSMIQNALLKEVKIAGNRTSLANHFIKAYNLREDWSKNNNLAAVSFPSNSNPDKFSIHQNVAMNQIYGLITSKLLLVDRLDKKSGINMIQVTSKDENFSKYFSEVLAEVVSDFYIQTKTKKSAQNVKILQHQTDSVRAILNSAITGVAASSAVYPNANAALKFLNVPSQRRQVDVQQSQAILSQLVQNLEMAKLALRQETPLIQIIDIPVFPLPSSNFGTLKGVIFGSILGMCIVIGSIVLKRVYTNILKGW